MSQYPDARFLTSANAVKQFVPDTGAEVAVAGRSNAGKSSAINVIVNRKQFARTSKTPGRTQLVNFFALRDDESEPLQTGIKSVDAMIPIGRGQRAAAFH